MTLVLAIPSHDGVVIASEGEVMYGGVRWQEKKLRPLNDRCVWGASGELALIQRVGEFLEALPNKHEPLSALRDQLSGAVKQAVTQLLQQDFRTQFLPQNPDALLELHVADFVFAEWDGKPRIMHLQLQRFQVGCSGLAAVSTNIHQSCDLHTQAETAVNGTSEWISVPFATGSGLPFAHALLQKYHHTPLDMQKASLLAFKVIEEAIEVGAFGLGPPIDVWQVTDGGVNNLTESEILRLEDASKGLREAEIQLFLQGGYG